MVQRTALAYDSANGAWPIDGDGEGEIILAYAQDWGGWYNGQHYATNVLLAMAKHPKATIVQISSVSPGLVGVDIYDVEPGCLTPEEAAICVSEDVKQNRRPAMYANAEEEGFDFDACNAALAKFGLALGIDHRVDFLLADPDGFAVVPANCIGKQFHWGPNIGLNAFDTSIILTSWRALVPHDPAV
jgi:hypothetical protein